ncbi:hypothetical protein F4821DRAFT_261404 [Hypoxylon rubiginosum]|uniref:Uncharacterized protein n=1 Tax=Hypoxylon rubiginosum TaxID=110542 RepID=A0ACC0CXK9_9PEZI|nr:hypothetical protein F4821DRAFT_261404 [Hypoxylon rubiginosum]
MLLTPGFASSATSWCAQIVLKVIVQGTSASNSASVEALARAPFPSSPPLPHLTSTPSAAAAKNMAHATSTRRLVQPVIHDALYQRVHGEQRDRDAVALDRREHVRLQRAHCAARKGPVLGARDAAVEALVHGVVLGARSNMLKGTSGGRR